MTPATVTERRSEQTTDKPEIRPFHFEVPEAELIRIAAAHQRDTIPRERTGRRFFAGSAARDDAEARALLGDRLRLAEGARRSSTLCRSSSPRSMGSTSTSFTFVRRHENALPLIVTHGWPGSGWPLRGVGAAEASRRRTAHRLEIVAVVERQFKELQAVDGAPSARRPPLTESQKGENAMKQLVRTLPEDTTIVNGAFS